MDNTKEKSAKLKILEIDPYLSPFENDLNMRMERFEKVKKDLICELPDLKSFANGYMYYGFQKEEDGWYYREWAPAAEALYLFGDFNDWNATSHPLKRIENGNWEIFLPGTDSLKHLSLVKVRVISKKTVRDRLPLYIRRTVMDPETNDFKGQIWDPVKPFRWTDESFKLSKKDPVLIYEAHVGMAQEKEGLGTYTEFKENILPRVKEDGYNTIQLMAVMEHPYYASFGYQVSNFFAVSSWFGTPDELKDLINTAHKLGIRVLLDIVHSHAIKNLNEGINEFDGTDYQFFHSGPKGNHPAWDTKLFNYGKYEVLHFLLSNVKFWLDEYHFDGFRFDGVSSMLYHHQGLGVAFTDYGKYFSMDTDVEAVTYLSLANELIKEVNPNAITISEDMSGMPGMCLPVSYGGIGFDYRLSMGVPDLWIKNLAEKSDDHWSMRQIWYELVGRRPKEKNIGYAESHDQALVGDKTIMFRLADKEMYWHMAKDDNNMAIDRAIALHKMIRLVSLTLSGEGYLNFMGNEFGHPEWIDFPREGNGWSFKYARRQWSLVDRKDLKFEYLANFDKAMLSLVKEYDVMGASDLHNMWIDEEQQLLAFKKGGLIFLFNFNPTRSFNQYGIPVDQAGKYQVVFSSDDVEFGGHSRISKDYVYKSSILTDRNNSNGVVVYSPSRTVLVLKKI